MIHDKWVVEIEDTKYNLWATDMSDAIEQAIALGAIKVYKHQESMLEDELVTKVYPSCIDQEVIDALTPQELCKVVDRINEELNNRNVSTVTIPNYANLMKED